MSDVRTSSLMARAAILITDQQWAEALNYLDQLVPITREEYGEHDRRVAEALEKRSDVLKQLERRLEAEHDLHEAVTIRLQHMRRRTKALTEEFKYTEAEALYREAIHTCERAFGPHHRETATCLDNLATNLRSQSRFEEAMLNASRAMQVREVLLGDDHAHTAASYSNVGYLCRILGRHDDAHTLLLKSLAIRERIYGHEHPLVAESLDRLASVYRELGHFNEAKPRCEEALRIRAASLGPDHPLTAASRNNLALIIERRSDTNSFLESAAGTLLTAGVSPTAAPKPAAGPRGKGPRQGNAVGYAILATLLVSVVAAGVTCWFFPLVGVIAGLCVIALTAASYFSSVSFERLVLLMVGRVRKAIVTKPDVDRNRVDLGRAPRQSVDLTAMTRSAALTADDIRQFPPHAPSDVLDLHWVRSMTLAAADELTRFRCSLKLNRLQELPSKLARVLKEHQGGLHLDGIGSLTPAAAAHIARHQGPTLQLNGLSELRPDVAEQLSHHRGSLSLTGLHALDEESAGLLVKHRGTVTLTSLKLVTRETVTTLRSNPRIELPEDLG
ncbi:MAG: tetratricopeptide repeat protein, partial [Planctomycetota bacterium]